MEGGNKMNERPTPETDCESGFFDMETAVGAAFARRLERERDEARAELKEKQEIIHRSCVDWAEDHTYLQNLCREAGGTEQEIEGDSYGVPGIIDLANYLKQLLIKQQDATQNTVKLNEEHLCAFHGDMLGNCLVCQLEEIK
jgi:hypothetical protein